MSSPSRGRPFDILLRGNYRARDDEQMSIDEDRYQRQVAYGILDLSVSLREKEGRCSAVLLVKNVLDKGYVSVIGAQNENLIPNGYFQLLPRTFERRIGAELRYQWL